MCYRRKQRKIAKNDHTKKAKLKTMPKKNQPATADQVATDEMFAPVAPPADAPTPTEAALNAAFDAEANAPTPGGIDFAKLAEDARAASHTHSGTDHGGTGDNTPIDVETGEPVTSGFFMDLSKPDDFELIDAGTRAVVSCTAAEAVVSSAGNPMLNLRVKIERVKGAPDMSKAPKYRNRSVKDRLMFIPPNDVTGSRGTIWRARLAFKAFDIEFDARVFRTQKDFLDWLTEKAELFIGSVAEVVIGVDDGTSGGTKAPQLDPQTGEPYPSKNTVAQYFKYAPVAQGGSVATEDLPF